MGRGRLLPGRGFVFGVYASKACCAACFDLELLAVASGLETLGVKNILEKKKGDDPSANCRCTLAVGNSKLL